MKLFLLSLLLCCFSPAFPARASGAASPAGAAGYVQTLKKLTDVMVFDVTGPCATARYYAYANLAAYEVLCLQGRPPGFPALDRLLPGYPPMPSPAAGRQAEASFAARYALLRMGEELLPSGQQLVQARDQLVQEASRKQRLPKETIQASMALAEGVVRQLLAYAVSDGYLKTSGYLRYTPRKEAAYWQPTPPAYQEAYEPHWGRLRPFLLDSAAQFRPLPEAAYSEAPGSPFQVLLREVYAVTRQLSREQKEIASFWDCNPFFLVQQGHVSYGTKKISPAGHWMGITGIACLQKQLSLAETIRWHTLVGLTMSDAFLACWKEKYRSERIRPETVINAQLDPAWRPLLQTPPFPEYPSGHSVVSAAVAQVLTGLAGGDFAYTDTSEVEFGLPARSFSSFDQAAREAAISRLYGGIHFRDAIEKGFEQGRQIGRFVLKKLQAGL